MKVLNGGSNQHSAKTSFGNSTKLAKLVEINSNGRSKQNFNKDDANAWSEVETFGRKQNI